MNDASAPASSKVDDKPVSAFHVWAFAAPAAPILALGLPTIMFLPHYYLTDLGLGAAALIFVLVRILDIIIDPMIGGWQDSTVSKYGRRRFWLTVCCPLLMFFVWLGFIGLTPESGDFIASVTIFLMFTLFAAINIAHLGWAGELIPTYHGRTRVLGAVQVMSLVGQVAILALAAYVRQGMGGTDADAVHIMGWTIVVMLPITTAIAVLAVHERQLPPQPHLTIRQSLGVLSHNKFAQRVLLCDLLFGVTQGVAGTLFLFYFQIVLGFTAQSQTLLFIYFVAGLIGVPIWTYAARRWSKHVALMAAFVYTAATTAILPFLPVGNFGVVAPLMALAGLSQGGGILLTRALIADVVDHDELESGARRSGLYFGLLLTTSKLGITAGPLALLILQLIGFDAAKGAANDAGPLAWLGVMFIIVPILLSLAAAACLWKYPLDADAQAALRAAIATRQSENSANTLGPSTK